MGVIRYIFSNYDEAAEFYEVASGKIPEGRIEVFGESQYSDEDTIVHIGYCSGYKTKVGSLVEPVYVVDAWTMEIVRTNPIFPIEHRFCFSRDEAVDTPMTDCPAIYDKELFRIAEKPHKRIHAIKIVRERFDGNEKSREEPWVMVTELLSRYLRA